MAAGALMNTTADTDRWNRAGDAQALGQQAAELTTAGHPPCRAASHTHGVILAAYGNKI